MREYLVCGMTSIGVRSCEGFNGIFVILRLSLMQGMNVEPIGCWMVVRRRQELLCSFYVSLIYRV